eukprot:45045-Eustigmatos_ZCMA.PRE.1
MSKCEETCKPAGRMSCTPVCCKLLMLCSLRILCYSGRCADQVVEGRRRACCHSGAEIRGCVS